MVVPVDLIVMIVSMMMIDDVIGEVRIVRIVSDLVVEPGGSVVRIVTSVWCVSTV